LRTKNPNQPSKFIFLFVGGGISGLSAARQFSKGIHIIFSGGIRKSFGGNSSSGEKVF
jgi:hypothetical protein